MRLVQMKSVRGLFWVKKYKMLKTVPMGAEAGIPLMHELTDPI
jgi:hypothetical protein